MMKRASSPPYDLGWAGSCLMSAPDAIHVPSPGLSEPMPELLSFEKKRLRRQGALPVQADLDDGLTRPQSVIPAQAGVQTILCHA